MDQKQNPFQPLSKKKTQDSGTAKNSKAYENDFGSEAGIGGDQDQWSKSKNETAKKESRGTKNLSKSTAAK
jgi:hypothetical protein